LGSGWIGVFMMLRIVNLFWRVGYLKVVGGLQETRLMLGPSAQTPTNVVYTV